MITGQTRTPRLSPLIVRRHSLEEWLGRFKSVPIRFLVAPPGFGKTVALLGYLQHSPTHAVYCALPARCEADAFWDALGRTLGLATAPSHDEILNAVAALAPLEIALDCEEVPGSKAVGAILRFVQDLPKDVSLLIACRSRAPFHVTRLVSDGSAVLCDAERLAFDVAEIGRLAESCGVTAAHRDVQRMREATDGWPQVVSCALRKAAEDRCGLARALENWRARHGHLFHEFVAGAWAGLVEPEATLLRKVIGGSHLEDRAELQLLEEQGLFVIHTPEGNRPLRFLSHSHLPDRHTGGVLAVAPLHVRLFGWFSAEIDRQPVKWIRRRDRQVFKYVALQPNGCASRAEIGQLFWPGGDPHLVSQSLRTACSNIRKAIARIVGFTRVDEYFRVGDGVSVNLDNVVVDVNRFLANADDGDDQYHRGQWQSAYAHYRRAASIYGGGLLLGDGREPWAVTYAAALRQRHAAILTRLGESGAEHGRLVAAAAS
jgi:hypothetical protein